MRKNIRLIITGILGALALGFLVWWTVYVVSPALVRVPAVAWVLAWQDFLNGRFRDAADKAHALVFWETHSPDARQEARLLEANSLYRLRSFSQALRGYAPLRTQTGSGGFIANHNAGNALYRLGEGSTLPELRRAYYQAAVEAYAQALAIHEDLETRANYDFVRNKLLQEQQKEQEQQQDQKSQNNSGSTASGSNSSSSWSTGNGEQTQSGSTAQSGDTEHRGWSNASTFSPQGNGGQNGNEPVSLSEAEKRALEEYSDSLKEFESTNQNARNLDGKSRSSGVFGSFFGMPSFSDDASQEPYGNHPW